jgi:TRAP-type C4-dicarboxylate transport system permease large subunit
MSQELFRAAYAFIGQPARGLAMAPVWASAGFGDICGGCAATAATMAKVAYPSMKRSGGHGHVRAQDAAARGADRHRLPGRMPFVWADVGRLAILVVFPIISLWLPSLMR